MVFAVTLAPLSAPSATEFADRLALVKLLRGHQFEQLDDLIRNYQQAYQTGAISESQLEAVYFAFANSSSDLGTALDRWLVETPRSYPALMARGVYSWNLGLLVRGPRTERTLSADHQRQFRSLFAAAGADLIDAIKVQPRLGIAYSLLIHMASNLGDGNDVTELIRRGTVADPNSIAVHRRYLESQRSWVLGGETDEQRSLGRIQRYVSNLAPRFASHSELAVLAAYPILVKADLLVRNGDRAAAISLYDQAATHRYWVYLYRRGVNHFRLNSFALALRDFDGALELRPQAAEILGMRARTLSALNQSEAAELAWSQALTLNPRDPMLLFHRAVALRDAHDFEAAAGLLTRAIELGEHNAHLWDARGRIYLYDLQQFDKAVPDLEHTIDFAPTSQRFWFNYATALYRKRDCGAVGALRYYLNLCEIQTCPAESMQWAMAWSEG